MSIFTAARRLGIAAALVGAGLLPALPAQATNGYFAHGHGAPSKGMAGAGTAHNRGPLAAATNPALGVRSGNVAGACLTHFRPDREVQFNGSGVYNGRHVSDNNAFNILCGGVNKQLDDGETAIGALITANGGMNTEYGPIFGTTNTGVDMAQMFMGVNFARKIDYRMTLGIMPMLAAQRIRVTGVQNFAPMSVDANNMTDRGYSYSFGGGVKVGALYDVNSWLSVGASYQSRLMMQKFEKYKGLFAEGGDFDIPPIARVGIAVRPFDDWTFLVDREHIFYGQIAAISNSGLMPCQLGTATGCGFGWTDMRIWRVAAEWNAMPGLTLRTGYSWSNDFADSNEVLFNVLAPATVTQHASVGASYKINESWGITGAYTRAFADTKTGVLQGAPFGGGGTAKLGMDQHELSLGVSYSW